MTKDEVLNRLTQLTEPQIKNKQLANLLGIHEVSWRRIKSGMVKISDDFMKRVDKAFPEWGIFLPTNATDSVIDASQNPHQSAPNKNLMGFFNKARGLVKSWFPKV